MSQKEVTIILVVFNGENWLRKVLDSIKSQTYQNIQIRILDNASTDSTVHIIEDFKKLTTRHLSLVTSAENIGPWAGFEKLLKDDASPYVILCTDVILDHAFVQRSVDALETDPKLGAIQARIYQMDYHAPANGEAKASEPKFTQLIDTAGFEIYRSRKLVNKWHGLADREEFNKPEQIFGVEGAVPVFRREALENCRIDGHLIDPNYRVGSLGYGDDFDLAWRMTLFGWKQLYLPGAIGYHDRSTTKGTSHTPIVGQLGRVKQRWQIAIIKRRLDWSNVRFTIIKNDHIINILRDLPYILAREILVLGYTVLFEPDVLREAGRFFRLLPIMLRTRKQIMQRAKANASAMRHWFR